MPEINSHANFANHYFNSLSDQDKQDIVDFHQRMQKLLDAEPKTTATLDIAVKPKQVIVVRTDLKMPVGKIASQVAHAAMGVLLGQMEVEYSELYSKRTLVLPTYSPMFNWLEGEFTKAVVGVGSEEELLELVERAKTLNIAHCLITDNGHTVFNGVKTNTCAAFGPDVPNRVNSITGHLKLL